MTRAAVLGLGQVSAVGAGIGALRLALAGNAAEPRWVERWPGDTGPSQPILRADSREVRGLIPAGTARRLDEFGVGAVGAALLAIQDAGLEPADLGAMGRAGIVVATGYGALGSTFGFLHDVIAKGDGLASPIHFSRSVHNAPAFVISSSLAIRGPTTTLTGFSLAWPRALATALDWLAGNVVDVALLCSADEQHPVLVDALRGLGVAVSAQCDPRQLGTPTYLPGETYTAMLLARPGEHPAPWGRVQAPTFFSLGPSDGASGTAAAPSGLHRAPKNRSEGPLLLATQGLPDPARHTLELVREEPEVAAYGPRWGSNPTAFAMTVLTALLSLRDGRLHPMPAAPSPPSTDRPAQPDEAAWLVPGERPTMTQVRCGTVNAEGRGAIVRAHR